MTEPKHTPTPWCISSESPRIIKQAEVFVGAGGVLIGSVTGNDNSGFFPTDEEALANAALIVEAVNSYASLRAANAAMRAALELTNADAAYHLSQYRPHVLEAIRAALAQKDEA